MAKNIIKEIIIILLLTLAIILIMGVLLYGYSPSGKILPEEVSYTTPEEAKQEIASDEGIDENQIVMTYEVTASDLKNYQKTNEYVQGKRNPFASLNTEETNSNSSGNTNSNSNTSSSNKTNSSNTSTNTSKSNTNSTSNSDDEGYFPDKGIK